MNQTKIIVLPIEKLVPAEWNYKVSGNESEIEKLTESIRHDKSAGVIAVREIVKNKKNVYEVIDGNHRLIAVGRAGWKNVPCENFGKISKANAILIAKRRNHKWFEDDSIKFSELFRDEVLKEYSLDDLEKFMPESRIELEAYEKLIDFDFNKFGEQVEFEAGEKICECPNCHKKVKVKDLIKVK